jgi:hypothetical protein
MSRATRKITISATMLALLSVALAAALGQARQPVPTLPVSAGPTTVTVGASGPVPAGPTRFDVTRAGDQDVSVYFLLLNAGVSRQEVEAALARDDRTGRDSRLGLVWMQASLSLSGSETRRGVTYAATRSSSSPNRSISPTSWPAAPGRPSPDDTGSALGRAAKHHARSSNRFEPSTFCMASRAYGPG